MVSGVVSAPPPLTNKKGDITMTRKQLEKGFTHSCSQTCSLIGRPLVTIMIWNLPSISER